MTRTKKGILIVGGVAALTVIGVAVFLSLISPPGSDGSNEARTPLGALFHRASAVSQLKEKMGDLRGVHPALLSFAKGHDDELPKTISDMRPFLPAKLAFLDDEHWELPATGKLTPLLN